MPFTYSELGGVLAQDEEERFGFAEGGMPTTRNDDEVISMLTRDIQKAAPYLDAGEAIEIYSKEEIKGYPKGITQTVYRNLEEGSDIESLEQFDLTDEIGVHVDTKKQIRKQAGKVRLYNSLDLRQRQVENFKGATFIQTLIDREEVKNTIIKHSKLTKEEAEERIKDLIADYQSTIKAVKAEEPVDVERVNYAMNVKLSQEARSILNELGYDSILYNKEGATSAILFEQGQFRATESPPPSTSVTQEQMNNLGFERKGFAGGGRIGFAGGKIISLLARRGSKLSTKHLEKLRQIAERQRQLQEQKFTPVLDQEGKRILYDQKQKRRQLIDKSEIMEQRKTERLNKLSPLELKRRNKLLRNIKDLSNEIMDINPGHDYIEDFFAFTDTKRVSKTLEYLRKPLIKKMDKHVAELKKRYGENSEGLHPSDYEGLGLDKYRL